MHSAGVRERCGGCTDFISPFNSHSSEVDTILILQVKQQVREWPEAQSPVLFVEGGTKKKPQNYLLEGVPLEVQASPAS